MKIILLRIPEKTTTSQVRELVNYRLSKKFTMPIFGNRPSLLSVDLVEHVDPQKVKDYYAVIEVDSENTGKWLLKHCKALVVNKKQCFIREYFERKSNSKVGLTEDRREGNDVHKKHDIQVESNAQNSRKHSR
jgi:hypothetical protein